MSVRPRGFGAYWKAEQSIKQNALVLFYGNMEKERRRDIMVLVAGCRELMLSQKELG